MKIVKIIVKNIQIILKLILMIKLLQKNVNMIIVRKIQLINTVKIISLNV